MPLKSYHYAALIFVLSASAALLNLVLLALELIELSNLKWVAFDTILAVIGWILYRRGKSIEKQQ